MMRLRKWSRTKLPVVVLIAAAVLVLAPVTRAQSGITVQRTTVVDAQSNTVVTERTFKNGTLMMEAIRVVNAQGRLISRVKTIFDPATGQAIKRQTVRVTETSTTRVIERLQNGQVARRVEQVVTGQHGQRVVTERVFEMVNDQLEMVRQEERVQAQVNNNGQNQAEIENEEVNEQENELENEQEPEQEHGREGGHDGGGGGGDDHGGGGGHGGH